MRFKTYVIFKGESGKQVWVSYSFGQESSSMANYKSERMNEIIPGVYVKEVVVFHGESLVYSIDGVVGTSVVVESDILKMRHSIRMEAAALNLSIACWLARRQEMTMSSYRQWTHICTTAISSTPI